MLHLMLFLASGQAGYRYLGDNSFAGITTDNGIDKPVTISIIYDNYSKAEGIEPDWGFALFIDGLEREILFDAGAKTSVFQSNLKKMSIDVQSADFVVFSHEHGDHTGGIQGFTEMRKNIPVVMPQSFSSGFKERVTKSGLEPVLVGKPAMICKNLYTSGEFDGSIPEQALVLNTKSGLVVMTGCSHPGIVEMLKQVKRDFGKDIYAVFGGFHLLQKSDKEVNEIISAMKEIGVIRCGATHCTGDSQIRMFRDQFGENFIEMGAGNKIVFN